MAIVMELVLPFIIGTAIGIITGLLPGIHSNLASSAIAAYIGLDGNFSNEAIAVMIISMGVAHSITDNIPSILLGMPDAEKIMSALPSQRMLLEGKGIDAVMLSITGTLFGTILAVAMMPITVLFFSVAYFQIKWAIGYILLVLLTILMMNEKKKMQSLLILIFTGILGIFVFRLNMKEPLLPLLTGLFGTSALIFGLINRNTIPKQHHNACEIKKDEWLKPSFVSLVMGILSSFLPGLGPSQIASLGSKAIKKITERGYIVLSSALSTVNLIAGIAAFYAIGKSRSGVIAAIEGITGNISLYDTTIMAFASLAAGGIATIFTIYLAKRMISIIHKVNYSKLCLSIILFVMLIVLLISGLTGLMVLLTASAIGIITITKEIPRQNMMGCLILPVLLFFMGISLS